MPPRAPASRAGAPIFGRQAKQAARVARLVNLEKAVPTTKPTRGHETLAAYLRQPLTRQVNIGSCSPGSLSSGPFACFVSFVVSQLPFPGSKVPVRVMPISTGLMADQFDGHPVMGGRHQAALMFVESPPQGVGQPNVKLRVLQAAQPMDTSEPKNRSSTTDSHGWTRITRTCRHQSVHPEGERAFRSEIRVHPCLSVVYEFLVPHQLRNLGLPREAGYQPALRPPERDISGFGPLGRLRTSAFRGGERFAVLGGHGKPVEQGKRRAGAGGSGQGPCPPVAKCPAGDGAVQGLALLFRRRSSLSRSQAKRTGVTIRM